MDYKLYNLKLNCLFVTFILLLTNHNDKLKRQYYQLSRNENQITWKTIHSDYIKWVQVYLEMADIYQHSTLYRIKSITNTLVICQLVQSFISLSFPKNRILFTTNMEFTL